ncbi:MAG: hypothetical protein FJ149_03900 [Euryarchaeota archaeon]|nr:hypothetical protein [Euryarchaeota archaeon]
MAGRAAAALALAILIVQPALALPAGGPGAEGPAGGRFVPEDAVVLFDEAHFPVYTVNPENPAGYASGNEPRGAYAAFARVLEKAGMTVRTFDYGAYRYLDADALSGVKVLVIVCSQGLSTDGTVSAPYTADETEAILRFVRNGGGLFLIGDHTTFPPAIFPVAEKFGIGFAQRKMQDPTHNLRNDTLGQPSPGPDDANSFIYFERARGNLGDHPIMNNISRVELYRTDYFSELPDEAVPLITTDSDTYYYDGFGDYVQAPGCIVSAAIPSNTTAGAGRVVVVADTNTFETDENRDTDDDYDLFDSDNELYGLQAVEWLADVPVHLGVDIYSAEADTYGGHEVTRNATAGALTTFGLGMANAGNVPDTYDLSAGSDRPGWTFGLSFSEAALRSLESRPLNLTVRAPPDALPGDSCTVTVTARSRQDARTSGSVECRLVVPRLHALELTCPENRKTVDSGQPALFALRLRNLGNVPERLAVSARAPPGWEATLDAGLFGLDPGRERQLGLTVTPPADALGGSEGAVTVVAQSTEMPSLSAENTTFTRLRQRFALELSCPFPELTVDPGSLASFPVTVANRGNGDDEVTLSPVGGSRWNTYIEPQHFLLPFNSTVEAAVVTRAPAGSPANESQSLAVLAASVTDRAAQDRLGLRATVGRMAKFTLSLEPPTRYVDPGETGEFDLTVVNTGNTFETVHLSAESPGELSALEAAVPMAQSARARLSVPVSPREQAWTTLLVGVEAVSAQDPEVSRFAVATVVVNQVHRIRGELLPAIVPVMPGAAGTTELRVWNEGNGPDVATCSVEGGPPGWAVSVGSPSVNLPYLGLGRTALTISVPPDAAAGAVDLAVALSDGAGRARRLVLTVNVLRLHNFTAGVVPALATTLPGRAVDFTLVLNNLGNSAEVLTVAPAGRRAGWISPEAGSAAVNRSSAKEVVLHVRPDLDAPAGMHRLNVTVTGEDGTAREVTFVLRVKEGATTQNDLPCWVALALVLAAVAAALAVRGSVLRAQGEARAEERPPGKSGGDG